MWNPWMTQMMMTNKKRIIRNIKTLMKVLSTKPNKKKHWLNGWCLWISKTFHTICYRETLDVIPLMSLVGVNHRQPILHMSKIMVHCYSTYRSMNKFAIGYMIKPSLNCTKVFR